MSGLVAGIRWFVFYLKIPKKFLNLILQESFLFFPIRFVLLLLLLLLLLLYSFSFSHSHTLSVGLSVLFHVSLFLSRSFSFTISSFRHSPLTHTLCWSPLLLFLPSLYLFLLFSFIVFLWLLSSFFVFLIKEVLFYISFYFRFHQLIS